MYEYRDPARLTTVAIAFLGIYMATELGYGLVLAYDYSTNPAFSDPLVVRISDFAALPMLVMLIACYVVVGMWIYRASANAHAISDEMTITPGWAVGWYFVPIMNLFKPFQAMREIWMASHFKGNWHGEPAPAILGWWWGLWLASNILGNISFRLALNAEPEQLTQSAMLDMVGAAVALPQSLLLITIMRRIVRAQSYAEHQETFA
jgi:uncharacterized protein DUF4328